MKQLFLVLKYRFSLIKYDFTAGMPKGYLTVLPNGDLIPCMLLQAKLGNVREENITRMWNNSPILSKLRDRSLLEGECGRCVYRDKCAGCRGRAYEETGNINAADPGCWFNIEEQQGI